MLARDIHPWLIWASDTEHNVTSPCVSVRPDATVYEFLELIRSSRMFLECSASSPERFHGVTDADAWKWGLTLCIVVMHVHVIEWEL